MNEGMLNRSKTNKCMKIIFEYFDNITYMMDQVKIKIIQLSVKLIETE